MFLESGMARKIIVFLDGVQALAVMIFSVDEQKNKVLVYAGVPDSAAKQGLGVLDWLRASLAPINGKGGGGKNGLAQGQV